MQQPPAAQSSSPCHDVAANQRVDEPNPPGNRMDTSESSRNSEHSSWSQIMQQDSQYHDVVAEHPNTSTQCHAVTAGNTISVADQKGSSDDHEPMSENALFASDAEMLLLSNKGSERGSSILDSSSVSESPRMSLSEPDPRPHHPHPSTSGTTSRTDDTSPFRAVDFPNDMDITDTTFGSSAQSCTSQSWYPQRTNPDTSSSTRPPWRGSSRRASRRHGPQPYAQRGLSSRPQPRPPRSANSPPRGSRAGRRFPRGSAPSSSRHDADSREIPEVRHSLSGRHPWAHLVRPRYIDYEQLGASQVVGRLHEDIYRPIPRAGCTSMKFCRSLFLHVMPKKGIVPCTIPFIELPTLADAVRFRDATGEMLNRTLDGLLVIPPMPPLNEMAPKGVRSSTLVPEPFHGIRPVLYQIVTIRNNHLILEAKDFFIFMPDRLELHCIQLDKFAFNVQNRTYGYDRQLVSIRDFVWVYDLQPTSAALSFPADHLSSARIQRISATDPDAAFFFPAHRFAFVTPPVWSETRFGFVLSISKRPGYVNNFLMASEDSPEAVTVSSSIARFTIREIQDGDLLRVNTRIRASCAVRFSEPAVSVEARNTLCQAVKMFFPANPDDAMQPMDVAKLLPEDEEWITDRLGTFESYVVNQRRSARLMGQLFNAAASALEAYSSREDDLSHIASLRPYPTWTVTPPPRLRFQLTDMNSEAGWTKHRHVGVWVPGTTTFLRLKTEVVEQDWAGRSLNITLQTFPWNGGSLVRAASTQGTVNDLDRTASILVCVRLEKASASTIPAYEAVSQMGLLDNVPPTSSGREILDAVYGATPLTTARNAEGQYAIPPLFVVDEAPLFVRGRLVTVTEDQRAALALGNANFPVVGIQAAFGTGKTVVGACIAAQQARMGWHVIVTATTNAAVAQIAETILALDEYADLRVCRYIAEAIAFDESVPSTAADMHQLLKSLPERLRTVLDQDALEVCERFRDGRLRLEDHARNRGPDDRLTSQEREELLLAERDVSDLIDKVINIMFRHLPPQIVAITTSSLLNTTSSQGIFKNYFNDYDVILCDEASQVPEPVFAAILSRLPNP